MTLDGKVSAVDPTYSSLSQKRLLMCIPSPEIKPLSRREGLCDWP